MDKISNDIKSNKIIYNLNLKKINNDNENLPDEGRINNGDTDINNNPFASDYGTGAF